MRFARYVAGVAGLFFLVFGLWAFFDARSFYEQIATYPPYNRHLLHDIGAFQAGLGAALLIGLAWTDAIAATLAGAGIGSTLHAAAHWWDEELGGRSSDPYALTLLALVVIAAAVIRRRSHA